MDPNGKLFEEKIKVPRSRVEITERGIASKQIVWVWNDQSKDNHRRAE